jgi:transposase-like protein
VCPRCGSIDNAGRIADRDRCWFCRVCRHRFTVMHGTPMAGTHLPLRTWFGAIFLMSTSSKGVSAMVLSRQLDLGCKTAWFPAHQLRDGSAAGV